MNSLNGSMAAKLLITTGRMSSGSSSSGKGLELHEGVWQLKAKEVSAARGHAASSSIADTVAKGHVAASANGGTAANWQVTASSLALLEPTAGMEQQHPIM
jgi:hypothetical protein